VLARHGTIASLWSLDDESTAQLMNKFEVNKQALTKAEAGRAQRALAT